MGGKPDVRVRWVYDEPEQDDGIRVLVDLVWPRGLTKDQARLDQWCKQVAPSTQLRKWYSHDPERFEEFDRRYREELKDAEHAPALEHLRELTRSGTLTLSSRRAAWMVAGAVPGALGHLLADWVHDPGLSIAAPG